MNDTATAISPSLEIIEWANAGKNVVTLHGRIDSGNAGALAKRLQSVVAESGIDLVLDLAKLDYLTSAGFRVLLIISDDLEAQNNVLRLCHVNDDVRELFEMGGMLDVFSVYNTLEQALNQNQE